jgi:hypothetical protein
MADASHFTHHCLILRFPLLVASISDASPGVICITLALGIAEANEDLLVYGCEVCSTVIASSAC